jgi:hypothetical protein
MRRALTTALGLAVLFAIASWTRSLQAQGSSERSGERSEPVLVTNFPEVQRIAGSVVVPAPIPTTRLETFRAVVTPTLPAEVNDYTEAGVLDAAGFASISLGIAGTIQGRFGAATPLGALLLPDVPEIVANFRNHGVAQFGLRVEATAVSSASGLFQSETVHLPLGFPRYRVLLYNGTPRSAEVAVYGYLKAAS